MTKLPVSWSSWIVFFNCMPVCTICAHVGRLNWLSSIFFFVLEVQLYMQNALFAMVTNLTYMYQLCKLFYILISLCLISKYTMYVNMYFFLFCLNFPRKVRKEKDNLFSIFCCLHVCHRWRCSWIILLVEVFVLFSQICLRPRWNKDGKIYLVRICLYILQVTCL